MNGASQETGRGVELHKRAIGRASKGAAVTLLNVPVRPARTETPAPLPVRVRVQLIGHL